MYSAFVKFAILVSSGDFLLLLILFLGVGTVSKWAALSTFRKKVLLPSSGWNCVEWLNCQLVQEVIHQNDSRWEETGLSSRQ